MAPRALTTADFWNRVDKSDGCWLWTGWINPRTGYGDWQTRKKHYLPHRGCRTCRAAQSAAYQRKAA